MRHTGFSLLFVLALLFGAFATDSAAQGGGGFWEKMSGPGKWAYFYGFYSTCLDRNKKEDVPQVPAQEPAEELKICSLRGNRVWLNLGGSYAFTGAEDRQDLQSPDLKQISFEPSVDLSVVDLFDYAPVRLGVGAGVHRFWGEDVGLTRASLETRASLIFWHNESAHLGFRYAVKFFFKGFTAEDFGDPSGTFDTDGTDAVHTISIFFGL